MQIREEKREAWKNYYKNAIAHEYEARIVAFACLWADIMERELARGASVIDIMMRTAEEAQETTEEVSEKQFGISVLLLSFVWAHGVELVAAYNQLSQGAIR